MIKVASASCHLGDEVCQSYHGFGWMVWLDVHYPLKMIIFRFGELLSDDLNQVEHLIPRSTKVLSINRIAVHGQAIAIARNPLLQEIRLVAMSLGVLL